MNYEMLCITGATATGKTQLAVKVADRVTGEIISADSRQVYSGMDIGTGKDLSEYVIEKKRIPFHLINIHKPGYKYNVYEYQQDFWKAFTGIVDRGIFPILCGGTGLYIESVLKAYRLIQVPVNKNLRDFLKNKGLPELEGILQQYKKLHNKTDTDTRKRAVRAIEIAEYYSSHGGFGSSFPKLKTLLVGIKFDRENRRKRISERLHRRLEEGMVDEVKKLLESGVTADDLIYYGLEYKFITQYLLGESDYEGMVQKLNIAIHRFAKRQMTWFRRMERNGVLIHWIDGFLPEDEKVEKVLKLL